MDRLINLALWGVEVPGYLRLFLGEMKWRIQGARNMNFATQYSLSPSARIGILPVTEIILIVRVLIEWVSCGG